MERPITPSLLATFIEYAATNPVTAIEWHRFAVNHYRDERMENARRECVRLIISSKGQLSKFERDRLHSIADSLRTREVK